MKRIALNQEPAFLFSPVNVLVMFLFGLFAQTSYAQAPFKFKQIPAAALNMNSYPGDPSARAVILYEEGESAIQRDEIHGAVLNYTYTVRYKILHQEEASRAAFIIPLQIGSSGNKEKLVRIEGITVNPDRSTAVLKMDDVIIEEHNEKFNLAKFAMPLVREGSVFDLTYTISSPFTFNFQPWTFQDDIPKVISRYTTRIPANYLYNITLTGYLTFSDHQQKLERECFYFPGRGSADCSINTWEMKDIPAFVEEDFMSSSRNFLSELRFELQTFTGFDGSAQKFNRNWKDVDREILYAEQLGKQSRQTSYFKKELPEGFDLQKQDLEQAKKLYYFLQDHLTSNGKHTLFSDVDAKKAWETRVGSTTDLNLILLNLLKSLGYDAQLFLVATRDFGLPSKDIPSITSFNYALVKLDVDEKSYLLDLSDRSLQFGLIPFETLNTYGRAFPEKGESYWHPFNYRDFFSTVNAQIQWDMENNLIRIRKISSGYYAMKTRKEKQNLSVHEREKQISEEFEKDTRFLLDQYEITNLEDPEQKLIETIQLETEQETSNRILINPFLIREIESNPFTLKERLYPVDFGFPYQLNYLISVIPPTGYRMVSLPESVSVELPNKGGHLNCTYVSNDQGIQVRATLQMNQAIYGPSNYEALKAIFDQLIRIQNKNLLNLELETP